MPSLERAKKALEAREPADGMKCFGHPVEDFDKCHIIAMLAMSNELLEQARERHKASINLLTT